jgi:glycerate 2-kinase
MARVIQNFETLATNELRLTALSLAEAGYAAINTRAALVRDVRIENDELCIGDAVYPIAGRKIFFVGVGKCAIAAAAAIEPLLGDQLTAGIALDVANTDGHHLSKIAVYLGTHPLPSEINEHATRHIVDMLTGCTEDDIVLTLISGGGSTLLCLPEAPMTPADESRIFTALTAKGAAIEEMNTVRKHLSHARGGGLARAAYPAQVISLIISDVPGNNLEFISSGPTVRDDSTVDDAKAILDRYHIDQTNVTFIETAKDLTHFEKVTNTLFLTNQDALRAMHEEATRRGYTATIMTDTVTGEARDVGRAIVDALHTMSSKTVLLYGGESTVTLGEHPGSGGRNQEMALAVLADIHDDELLLPFASDGHDNTDHAGAIADSMTRAHADAHALSIDDALSRHCSYDFFTVSGDALITGYTESNVSDFIIGIKK